MAVANERLIDYLRRLAAPAAFKSMADSVLMARFLDEEDENAFTALVARHGPMVLNVCRRVVGHTQTAEDAFQATFLVLMRKAPSVRRGESLAAWLYGVAYRVALKARKKSMRDLGSSTLAAAGNVIDRQPQPLDDVSVRDLLALLQEEVQRLPNGQRLPMALCCLEGLSHKEAALRLGCTEGSIKAGVERGRARLHTRLTARGVTLSAALAVLEVVRISAVASGLARRTTEVALAFNSVKGITAQVASTEVLRLARYALGATIMFKMKVVSFAALAVGVIVLGAGGWAWGLATSKPDEPKPRIVTPELAHKVAPAKPAQIQKEMTGEQRLAFALEKMKKNLDDISEFTCRYSYTYCSAATLEDAILDRNVQREKPREYVLWIVKKPVERFLVVTVKEYLDKPVGTLIAPLGEFGPRTGNSKEYKPIVAANWLWDGSLFIRVSDVFAVSTVVSGFPKGAHPRTPGTPLEGEYFHYTEPDLRLKNHKDKDWEVSFAGIDANGLWEFRLGKKTEQIYSTTSLDPKRGFLPVFGRSPSTGAGGTTYSNWYATHFHKTGGDNWFTTRSIAYTDVPFAGNDEKQPVRFREFKSDSFDCEKKVAIEDLAITIPAGHEVQRRGVPDYAQMVNKVERLVDYKQLPQLWKDLEAYTKYWNQKK